jgi:hypothetical protein
VVDPNFPPGRPRAADPVSGDLFYANFDGGQIRRIQYTRRQQPAHRPWPLPTRSAARRRSTVQFNGSGSSDPDGDPLTYSWDLNGDGTYGDSTAISPSFTYSTAGPYTVTLKVTDSHGGLTVSAPVTITVGSGQHRPTPVIDTPVVQPHLGGRRPPSASPATPPTLRTVPCPPPP